MYGALLGDMIGAPYEFDMGNKTKEFPLFCSESHYTDDSVMTIAVAEALLDSQFREDSEIRTALVKSMRKWGRKYPHAGYGGRFRDWLRAKNPEPYGSYGNGSAMRVSAAGWLFDTLEDTRAKARLTAEVTHNHPEGIKGAEATASAIYLARTGHSKDEIRDFIMKEFGYDLSRTCDQIRPKYYHVESCQGTVPEAITAFLEGTDFEDVIRTAVSLGGDCDTLTCIAGSIAEAFYGVPEQLKDECRSRLTKDMLDILGRFEISRDHRHDSISSSSTEWTSPRWAKAGDIVFFMHSKTARSTITRLRSELIHSRDQITGTDYDLLMTYLEHALEIHSKYGGKIFALGRVCGGPEYVEPDDVFDNIFHWKSRTYSAIDNIHILENPIDISTFRDYIFISRAGAITPLFDHEFDRLREDIGRVNLIPEYVKRSIARPIPLRSINEENWIEIANDYRRCLSGR